MDRYLQYVQYSFNFDKDKEIAKLMWLVEKLSAYYCMNELIERVV